MTVTASELSRLYRCGELFRLVNAGVPYLPTTAQVVSRSVRAAIQSDLSAKMSTGALLATAEARSGLERIVRQQLSTEAFLTEQQVAMGQRRIFETVLLSAQRTYLMWRTIVGQKVEPPDLASAFTLELGEHSVTGYTEYEDATGFRATKVRSRRPEDGEASCDLSNAILSLAHDGAPVTVDYLIDTKELAYVRQTVEFDAGILTAAQERVKAGLEMLSRQCFLPTDSQNWICRTCQLRPICRYIA